MLTKKAQKQYPKGTNRFGITKSYPRTPSFLASLPTRNMQLSLFIPSYVTSFFLGCFSLWLMKSKSGDSSSHRFWWVLPWLRVISIHSGIDQRRPSADLQRSLPFLILHPESSRYLGLPAPSAWVLPHCAVFWNFSPDGRLGEFQDSPWFFSPAFHISQFISADQYLKNSCLLYFCLVVFSLFGVV